jgi:basic membrane lipoprotein Med (substrate-binding protein (PBP1-ABC) superfamily)
MPLMPEDSEFAGKWSYLCQSHVEEGIRNPIKAYEYLNRYYVEEGNKRVSVLKFCGADTVYAHVIRVMPERRDSKEIQLYLELLDFYAYSKISFIEFSRLGCYPQLQKLLGKAPEEKWSEEERREFSSFAYCFRQAYEASGGGRLSSTIGDAMLACLKVFDYEELKTATPATLKKSLSRVWEEIALQQEEEPIAVKLNPEERTGGGEGRILSRVFKPKPEVHKVAFIHDKAPETSGWTYGHELGRRYVEEVFAGDVETCAYFSVLDGRDPLEIIQEAIDKGNTTIFTTSPRLLPASLRAAVDNPKVSILNCSLNKSHRYVRTYYARIYEAKFVLGAIAGSLAGSNPVGYICNYPIFGQVAGINAFALGVQLVNPRIKVHLEWSSTMGEGDEAGVNAAAKRLRENGICLISSQDLAIMGRQNYSSFGLSLVNEKDQVNLAMPVWKWGIYYERILRSIRNGTFQWEYAESSKALNYYWGMSAGVVSVQCSDKVPDGAKKLTNLLRDGICSGVCDPFRGPLYAQDGRLLAANGESLTLEEIINMDWLVENIVGNIPAYQELNDMGKATVGIVGVQQATQQDRGAQEGGA